MKDSTVCHSAHADQLVVLRRAGTPKDPVAHPEGLSEYAGDWQAPPRPRAGCEFDLAELRAKYHGWEDDKTNKLSHWIWQRYASSFWDDIRIKRVLPYREARDPDDEKHVHPLQLDVIDRCLHLWSNPGDVVLDPFAGVGSTPYAAVAMGRKGISIELKPTFFRQQTQNVAMALRDWSSNEDGQWMLRWEDDLNGADSAEDCGSPADLDGAG
ncbi:MAG: site-specific DNA-methyltransferase [bacterium]|nr:site-specific DNA-methyltransferase [bacterium]